ncbi:unnamed protein product [Clonostachys solani]|uniref:Peptidase M61 catalytic domain-containing protein n=1 Tax=Clonostachys solani TaxID=160281 RepID=A0A9N9ZDU8_9HYPO|nr:unnamed protein product [Clonostachys solani]
MIWTKAFALSLQLACAATCAPKASSPVNSTLPSIDVELTPILDVENNTSLNGELVMDIHFASNETLLVLPLEMANAPSAQYTTETLEAWDRLGQLKLIQSDGTGSDSQPSRFWAVQRATQGPVVVRFKAKPRQIDPDVMVGPLFDIRANGDGLLGSTWALVPLPPDDTAEYQFSLRWNLKHSPQDAKAAWTWGEGPAPVTINGTSATFLYTFWAVGSMSTYPGDSDSEPLSPDYSMYWLEQPPFDVDATAAFVDKFFNYSSIFWKDTSGEPYRVFIRRNQETGTGGTALLRSFTFGWHDANSTTQDRLELLLSHEITHNWPQLNDVNAAGTRYTEGTAEYYSLRLLWRNNQISTETYLLEAYYLNPYVNLTDEDAYNQAWETRQAQRIPYGRGLIYLTNVDAQMRAISDGTESLDTIVLELLDICRASSSQCTEAGLLKLLDKHLGQGAVEEYHTVGTGQPLIQPLPDSLGPCFEVVETQTGPSVFQWRFKNGKDASSEGCQI